MPLDFKRGTDLFMGRDEELAKALRIEPDALRRHRSRPNAVPAPLLHALADVLDERGRAMVRVAEMLREEAGGEPPPGNGRNGP
jgi:hypothetical protein